MLRLLHVHLNMPPPVSYLEDMLLLLLLLLSLQMAKLLLTYQRAVLLLFGGWKPMTKTSQSHLVAVRARRWEWLLGLLGLQLWSSRKSQHLRQVVSWSRVDLWCKNCNNECNQWDWDSKTYQKRPSTFWFPVWCWTFINMIGRTPSASRTNMKWGTSERSTLNLSLSQASSITWFVFLRTWFKR